MFSSPSCSAMEFSSEIPLSLQPSQEIAACSPTALISLGLERRPTFSLILIANPKAPSSITRRDRTIQNPSGLGHFCSPPPHFEDFSSSITPTLQHHSWGLFPKNHHTDDYSSDLDSKFRDSLFSMNLLLTLSKPCPSMVIFETLSLQ